MRRPVFVGAMLLIALIAVIYGKIHLDSLIKEGRLETSIAKVPVGDDYKQNTIDLGVQPDPNQTQLQDAPPHATGSAHQDVMAALVEARQSFKNKEAVTSEAAADPHQTPNAVIHSAEKLGEIVTLEQAHPEYSPEFQAFYLECAKDPDVITVTRVQCVEKYVKSKKLNASEETQLLSEVDPVVKRLYLQIK
ncbi:MAG: hypothetical protein H7249_20620 [Chitinophagaceae bacterium]|nr:hypothetical protein [Oligoflexus sp.]